MVDWTGILGVRLKASKRFTCNGLKFGDIPLNPHNWEASPYHTRGPSLAWLALLGMVIVTGIPPLLVLLLTGLTTIPPLLYDVARLDGASQWEQRFVITVPLLRPTIAIMVLTSTLSTVQLFDPIVVMTQGGPAQSTLTPVYLIYATTFGERGSPNASYAAAMAVVTTSLLMGLTWLQRRWLDHGSDAS